MLFSFFRNKKIFIFLFLLIILILYLILENGFSYFFFCPIKKITKLYCPGCGVTRMVLAIFQLDFYQAFRYNPLVFILLPFITFFIIEAFLTKKEPLYNKIPEKVWIIIIVIFIFYGVLRNIPFFDFLAPTLIK